LELRQNLKADGSPIPNFNHSKAFSTAHPIHNGLWEAGQSKKIPLFFKQFLCQDGHMTAFGWSFAILGLAYVLALFGVATWADRRFESQARRPRPLIYALSIAVYCTSWTFYGSVGVAARSGYDFIPVYLGPILLFILGLPLIVRVSDIAKQQNIASIADFLSARYGKSQGLAALVAAIALIGMVPYISIQLKALSFSFQAVLPETQTAAIGGFDFALPATFILAIFTILFGTRHINTTEHQHGLMAAIATESIVKLLAFLAVGLFVTFGLAGGVDALTEIVARSPETHHVFSKVPSGERWVTVTLLSACAILLLPRQFHVTIVEQAHHSEVRRAAWLFPLYLVAINLFVIPVAIYGLHLYPNADPDTYVLAIPMAAQSSVFSILAFIGGVSAATAMVVVETIALAIMISNNIFVPLSARLLGHLPLSVAVAGASLTPWNVAVRRYSIVGILVLAYAYFLAAGNSAALAQTGLISFAAVAQFAPAFFIGLVWQRATARGAIAGIIAGFVVWTYTLLLPSFVDSGWLPQSFLANGPLGLSSLRPRQLFGIAFEPLTHGVFWSLMLNTFSFIVFSLTRAPTRIEQVQADAFRLHAQGHTSGVLLPVWKSRVTQQQLEETVARYLGADPARKAFALHFETRGLVPDAKLEVDVESFRFGEQLLSSAIGPASSRLVLGLLIERSTKGTAQAAKLLDDATAAVQYSRELLQSAIDNVPQAIAVFDGGNALSCYNQPFVRLLGLPDQILQLGSQLNSVLAQLMQDADTTSRFEPDLLNEVMKANGTVQFRLGQRVLETRVSAMPDGGRVLTFTDVTETVALAETLKKSNETLERRVAERTSELSQLNADLQRAKALAEQANIDKTRFIAAASHDILQPLNAARLFTSALVENAAAGGLSDTRKTVDNLNASLESVEDVLSTILDMSRLDAGVMTADKERVHLGELFDRLQQAFEPLAKEKGLEFRVVATRQTALSDRKLLRRVLENLLSNAIKYTSSGKVLLGCRRRGDELEIQVLDTGIGIPIDKQQLVFKEFERLDQNGGNIPGLGLGLSIVERMCRVLNHDIRLLSVRGKGTHFGLVLPKAETAAVANVPIGKNNAPIILGLSTVAGMHVLVIDDDEKITEGLSQLLGQWGIQVHVSYNAETALVVAKQMQNGIQAIIGDYHLGQDDGIALIVSLRAAMGQEIPAILVTADRSKSVQDEAARHGIIYMNKPVRPAALRATLGQFAVAVAAE
jgi:Na+/proline symporter/signal transduction histidine kinase/CheY-like chemotaxis protein